MVEHGNPTGLVTERQIGGTDVFSAQNYRYIEQSIKHPSFPDDLPADYFDRLVAAAQAGIAVRGVLNGYAEPALDVHSRPEEYYLEMLDTAGLLKQEVLHYIPEKYDGEDAETSEEGEDRETVLASLRYWLTPEEIQLNKDNEGVQTYEAIRPPLFHTMAELQRRYEKGIEVLQLMHTPTIMFKPITRDGNTIQRALDHLEEKGWITFFTDGTIVTYPKPKKTAQQTYDSIRETVKELKSHMYWGIAMGEGGAQHDVQTKHSVIVNSIDTVESKKKKRRRYSDGGTTATIGARRVETHLETLVRERILQDLAIDRSKFSHERDLDKAIAIGYFNRNDDIKTKYPAEKLDDPNFIAYLVERAALEANALVNQEIAPNDEIFCYSMFDPRGAIPEDRAWIEGKGIHYLQNTQDEFFEAISSCTVEEYMLVHEKVWYPKEGIFGELKQADAETDEGYDEKKNVRGQQSIEGHLQVDIDAEKSSRFRQAATEEDDIQSLVTELARMRSAQRVIQQYMNVRYKHMLENEEAVRAQKIDAIPYSVYAESARFLVPNIFDKFARPGYKKIPDRKQFDMFVEAVAMNMNEMSKDAFGMRYKVWILKHAAGAVARVFNGFLQDSTKIDQEYVKRAEALCEALGEISRTRGNGQSDTVLVTDDALRLFLI